MEIVANNSNAQLNDAVQSVLGQLLHEVDSSKTLHQLGLDTKLTAFISKLIENPVKTQIETHNNTFASLASTTGVLMNLFFKEQSSQISKVFKETHGNAIIYYILLNNDSDEIRNEFLEWLNVFDDFGFDEKVKVLIRFIPKAFSDKLSFKDEVCFL